MESWKKIDLTITLFLGLHRRILLYDVVDKETCFSVDGDDDGDHKVTSSTGR